MIKNYKYTIILGFLISLISFQIKAQLKAGQLVDGISGVVGNEIILESDVQEQLANAKQQNMNVDQCQIMENMLNQKFLIAAAKKDTLIEDRSAAIKEMSENKFSQILSQFPDEKTMLSTYNFKTSYEMKNAIEKIDIDNYYGQEEYNKVTSKADVSPKEVTDFFNLQKFQLPQVKDEVSIAQISMYPKISDAHKKEVIDKLMKIKSDIQKGASFDSQARIYSEDPGSAAKGGLYNNIKKGQMVKPFEAAALNLQIDEISDPVESEFGYHIIQLKAKKGNQYDAAHILIKIEPNASEIAASKKMLDSIKTLIKNGKMSFKDAAYKYSNDKASKFNGGVITSQRDGSDKIEKTDLSPTIGYQIAGLHKGDITDVFEDELNNRKTVSIIQVNDNIPAHQLSLETDYSRIKQFALSSKKNELVEKWVKDKIPNTFIFIDPRYSSCKFAGNWEKKIVTK